MGVLDFIFGIIALLVGAFVVIGTVCMRYDTKELEKENEKLKDDLYKERERKIKKASNVGGKNNEK